MHLSAAVATVSRQFRSRVPGQQLRIASRTVLPRQPRRPLAAMAESAPKRLKVNGSHWEHHVGPTFNLTGLQVTDHQLRLPLDHSGEREGALAAAFCCSREGAACAAWRRHKSSGGCAHDLCSTSLGASMTAVHFHEVSAGCTAAHSMPHPLASPPSGATPCLPVPAAMARAGAGQVPGTVEVFCRELVHRNKRDDKNLGYLLFLQGGCWRVAACLSPCMACRCCLCMQGCYLLLMNCLRHGSSGRLCA